MGVHTVLLDYTRKESIDLGKKTTNNQFQMPSDVIIKFLADRVGNTIKTMLDTEDLPEYDDEVWKEIDSFSNY